MAALVARMNQLVDQDNWKSDANDIAAELFDRVEQYGNLADSLRAKAKERRNAALPDDAALVQPPADVLEALDSAIGCVRTLAFEFNELSLYVWTRVPDMKDEDNAGVAVQQNFLEMLKNTTETLNGGKDCPARFVHLGAKQSYLNQRAELEAKLAPTGKEAEPSKSASLRRQLHDLDAGAVGNVAWTYAELRRMCLAVGSTYTRNMDKLHQPRRSSNSMIG